MNIEERRRLSAVEASPAASPYTGEVFGGAGRRLFINGRVVKPYGCCGRTGTEGHNVILCIGGMRYVKGVKRSNNRGHVQRVTGRVVINIYLERFATSG